MPVSGGIKRNDDGDESSGRISLIAGVALGLLFGAVVGLSTAPVATTVVGGIVALLAAFFGLAESKAQIPLQPANRRLVAFCLAGLLAMTISIYVRTHDLLSPPPSQPQTMKGLSTELGALGYPSDRIKELLELRFFGLVPPGRSVTSQSATQPLSSSSNYQATILFSGTASDCAEFSKWDSQPIAVRLTNLRSAGGILPALVTRVEAFSESEREKALNAARFLLCAT